MMMVIAGFVEGVDMRTVGRPIPMKMKDFLKLKKRVKIPTIQDLEKRIEKLEKKVRGLEMMILKTRTEFILEKMKGGG